MKTSRNLLMALCFTVGMLFTVTAAFAGTNVITSVWDEFQTSDGGLNNVNVWTNVWTTLKTPAVQLGFYAYGQVADPQFKQIYGGPAMRTRNGLLELGVGGGFQNDHGRYDGRLSQYAILTIGHFTSANWVESSSDWWALSVNTYQLEPRVEVGYRMQRWLGGGPMVRYTANIGPNLVQPYATAMFDGDRINPVLGLNVTFK